MKVLKTIKLFAGGKFIRSESGRSYPSFVAGSEEEVYARLCQASRKDFRNTVDAALGGFKSWSSKTPFNRSQILYRMAEMAESKRHEFVEMFQEVLGLSKEEAVSEFELGVDTFVYYAGMCDKYQQLAGTVNPIHGPFHNFSTPEATGVVTLITDEAFNFANLIDAICSIIISGNSVIVLFSSFGPVMAPLSEVMATSDLPGGAVNFLTGDIEEIIEVVANHREVRSICYLGDNADFKTTLQVGAAENMKRLIFGPLHPESLEGVLKFVEFKTVWHPIGQ